MMARQAGYESFEYDRLVERGFRPYSLGHRRMYLNALEDMKARGVRNARVLEAGFGIGYGLGEMLGSGLLKSYVGYEPNKDAFNYTKGRYLPGGPVDLLLLNAPYEPNLDPAFDVAFCIEVIEHVPMDKHVEFLRGLCSQAPVLYMSTPDKDKKPSEGVRTQAEWLGVLAQAGYGAISVHTKEWTYLYRCERRPS